MTILSDGRKFRRALVVLALIIAGGWILTEKTCHTRWFEYGQKLPVHHGQ